jgi:hypothetical protein
MYENYEVFCFIDSVTWEICDKIRFFFWGQILFVLYFLSNTDMSTLQLPPSAGGEIL